MVSIADNVGIKCIYKGRTVKRDWECDNFDVTLSYEGKSITVDYMQGTGYDKEPPELHYVLSDLISDYHIKENFDFDGFCEELGYDKSNKFSKEVYEHCTKNGEKLSNLFGVKLPQLIDEIEEY